jgi:hypothetical protein
MSRHVFAFQGVAVFALGIALGWATYDTAVASGSMPELIMTFLSLPLLYLGISLFKEYEFSEHELIARQSILRDESRIRYDSIRDVRLTYLKYGITPPLYTLAIDYDGGTEKVGFGFRIDEVFLKDLADRVGHEMISREG